MASCRLIFKLCQSASERLDYAFDWTHEFANRWQPRHPYAALDKVRPSTPEGATGFEYVSSGGVSSGDVEPEWPTTLGETVVDGSITWTAAALSVDSLRHRIAYVLWTADTGLTLDGELNTDEAALQETRIYVSGGVAGQIYRNFVQVETDQGAIYEGELKVTVE